MSTRRRESLRIVGAIVRKDLLDALKNRMLLTIGLGVMLTILTSQALPLLLTLQQAQPLYLLEGAGDGSLPAALDASEALTVRPLSSLETLQQAVGAASGPVIGLALTDEVGEIDAYFPYWLAPRTQAELIRQVEEVLLNETVTPINVRTHAVYPPPGGAARHFIASMILVVVLMLTGMFLTPYLLIEEREAYTMDALLVSPAGPVQIVIGKTLVGLVYCLMGAALTLTVNARLITSGLLLALGVLAGSLLFVAVGLLLGSVFRSMISLNMVGSAVGLMLLTSSMIASQPELVLSGTVKNVVHWVPTAALSRVLQIALSGGPIDGSVWLDLGVVLLAGLIVGVVVMSRMQRERV